MPTKKERREIAARLRETAGQIEFTGEGVEDCIFDNWWSYSAADGAKSYMRLADLIEPEERTCCNVGGEEWGFKCSECGGHTHGSPFHVPDEEREELAEMLGGRIVSLHGSVPRFCPNCGAKVVDDHA